MGRRSIWWRSGGEHQTKRRLPSLSLREAVPALLEAGARLDTTNRSGYTPLHYAAIFGRAAIAAELIRRGAPVNVPDRDGKTPLWRALHAPAMRYDNAGKSQVDTTEVAQVLRAAGGTK